MAMEIIELTLLLLFISKADEKRSEKKSITKKKYLLKLNKLNKIAQKIGI